MVTRRHELSSIPLGRRSDSSPISSTKTSADRSRPRAVCGFFARMRARFAQMMRRPRSRGTSDARGPADVPGPPPAQADGLGGRARGRAAPAVAAPERGRGGAARARRAGCGRSRSGSSAEVLQKDGDRHLRLLALHLLGLLVSAPFVRRARPQRLRLLLHLHGGRPLPGVSRRAARAVTRCSGRFSAERRAHRPSDVPSSPRRPSAYRADSRGCRSACAWPHLARFVERMARSTA